MEANTAPILGYWNIRGLGEQIRYLLHYTETEYEDRRYSDYEQWMKEKYTLNLDFPNLPYYIDGDIKLTQSTTILRYLGRKHGLVATEEKDILRQELIEQQLIDLRTWLMRISYYTQDFENDKRRFLSVLPTQLRLLNEFLNDQSWMGANRLTYVDFMAYEILDFLRFFQTDCLVNFSNLQQYMIRFESLDAIQKYMNSKDHIKWPIFAPFAKFGGGKRL